MPLSKTGYILFKYSPNKSKINGFFDEDDGNIYINESLSTLQKELVLVHETEHKKCYLNKCFCWKSKTDFWCEYHAFKAEFDFVLNKNLKKYWNIYFSIVIKDLNKFVKDSNNIHTWKEHYKALRKVCKLCNFIKFAKKYGYWKKINGLCNSGDKTNEMFRAIHN